MRGARWGRLGGVARYHCYTSNPQEICCDTFSATSVARQGVPAHVCNYDPVRFKGRRPTQKPPTQKRVCCTNSLRKLFLPVFFASYKKEKGGEFAQIVPKWFAQTVFYLGFFFFWVGLPFMNDVSLCAARPNSTVTPMRLNKGMLNSCRQSLDSTVCRCIAVNVSPYCHPVATQTL